MTQYLSALRSACQSLNASLPDPAVQRRVDMIVHILNGLIAQSKSGAALDSAAVAAYQTLLQDETLDLAAARTAADRLVQQTASGLERRSLSSWQRIVDIERTYYEGAAQALQAELQRPKDDQQSNQSSGLPDVGGLADYLTSLFETPVRVAKIDTVSLGFSKATFMVDVVANAAVPASLVIRMDRANSFLGTTVLDEYPILRALHANGVSVPQPYGLESTGRVLGQPFMVVGRVYGRGLGSHFSFPPPNARLCSTMATALAKIHATPLAALSEALPNQVQDAYEQVVADIDKAYADWSGLKIQVPTVEIAFALLRQHARAATQGPRTLVHGDFSLSNLLIGENDEVAAILDWEFAGLGLPAADLGWCYEVATRLASWEQFLAAYQAAGGSLPGKQQLDFFALWGAVRLTVMVFQSRCGFERGELSDIKQAFVSISPPTEMVLRVSRRLQPLLNPPV